MTYEIIEDREAIHGDLWRVEAIDFESEAECHVAAFSGPQAEQRAREYAQFKNAQ